MEPAAENQSSTSLLYFLDPFRRGKQNPSQESIPLFDISAKGSLRVQVGFMLLNSCTGTETGFPEFPG